MVVRISRRPPLCIALINNSSEILLCFIFASFTPDEAVTQRNTKKKKLENSWNYTPSSFVKFLVSLNSQTSPDGHSHGQFTRDMSLGEVPAYQHS